MLPIVTDKNERFLRLCCNVARFFGLLLLSVFVFILILAPLIGWIWDSGSASYFREFVKILPTVVSVLVFPAFLFLGIEQLIKCLIVSHFKPNWIIRFGDKIIYIYAGFLLINFAYISMGTHKMIYSSGYDISFELKILIPSAILTFTKVLIWIGTGLFLKRIVPIIQESKTLV